MAEGVYRIDELRATVVACLSQAKGALQHDAIAELLCLPLWAVDSGLEAALASDQVEFAAGQGWWIKAGAQHAYR